MTSVRQRHKDMTTGRKIRLNVLSRSVYSSPGGFKPESLRSVSEQFGQPLAGAPERRLVAGEGPPIGA